MKLKLRRYTGDIGNATYYRNTVSKITLHIEVDGYNWSSELVLFVDKDEYETLTQRILGFDLIETMSDVIIEELRL